jgi:hypothetical protein
MQHTVLPEVSYHLPLDAILDETDQGSNKPAPIRKAVCAASNSLP